MEWADYLRFGMIQIVVTFAAAYFAAYLKTKGKNLATKEDIKEITGNIESVKTKYAKDLEGLKSQLNTKSHAQTVRFEKEFNSYKEIWGSLVEVRGHYDKLHLTLLDPNSREELIETERKKFHQVIENFCSVCEKNSPFFCSEVYDEILKLIQTEAVGTPVTYSRLPAPTAEQHRYIVSMFDELLMGPDHVLSKMIESIREAIRLRIQSF